MNLYAYVRNNPINLVDPFGLRDAGATSNEGHDQSGATGVGDSGDGLGGPSLSNKEPQELGVAFFEVAFGAFLGQKPSSSSKGIAETVAIGLAYDINTSSLHTYKSFTLPAVPGKDAVSGAVYGVGPSFGYVQGTMADFMGYSRERSHTAALVSGTSIETSSGKRGASFSIGGKGVGFGYTTIEAFTEPLF